MGGIDDRADTVNTSLSTTSHTPRCDLEACPGFGEPLAKCANPAHDAATDQDSPYFHVQRAGSLPFHGRRRRGRPRRLCGRACKAWVDNFYVLNADGTYANADTTWFVGREFKTYRAALREVGRLIATGVIPPRSPIVAFLLTPTKVATTSRLDDFEAMDLDGAS